MDYRAWRTEALDEWRTKGGLNEKSLKTIERLKHALTSAGGGLAAAGDAGVAWVETAVKQSPETAAKAVQKTALLFSCMKARTLAIANGKLKAGEPKIWFTSPESFAKLLSTRNRALLGVIADARPESIHALASATGRTLGNLSRTLRSMERYGIVRLHKSGRGAIRPEVPYSNVRLEMSLSRS